MMLSSPSWCVIYSSSTLPVIFLNRLFPLYHHFKLLETEQQLEDFLSYKATLLSGKDLALELADTLVHIDSNMFGSILCMVDRTWHIVLLSSPPERKRWHRCWNMDLVESQQMEDCICSLMEHALRCLVENPSKLLDDNDHNNWQIIPFVSPLQQLFQHQIHYCVWLPKYRRLSCFPRLDHVVIFPGSFHPLHRGHIELAKTAEQLGQRPVVFELSIENADKGRQSESQVMERLAQFTSELGYYCVLTVEPLFYKKAKLFPGAFFVVGVDTAQRMVDPKYYNNSFEEMIACLQPLMESGTKILVAGRIQNPSSNTGKYITLEDISIPWRLQNLFYSIPQEMFRCDISSTLIRRQQN